MNSDKPKRAMFIRGDDIPVYPVHTGNLPTPAFGFGKFLDREILVSLLLPSAN